MNKIQRLLLIILFVLTCASPLVTHAQKSSDHEKLARTVTIYRDTYGVPHVFGRTDESTVFGFAYAQAEDNFWRVEENFIPRPGPSV